MVSWRVFVAEGNMVVCSDTAHCHATAPAPQPKEGSMAQTFRARIGLAIALMLTFLLTGPWAGADIPPLSVTLKDSGLDSGFGLERAEFGMGMTELEPRVAKAADADDEQGGDKKGFCFATFNIEVCIGNGLQIHRVAVTE